MVDLENLKSHNQDSLPKISNFSQKMSENAEEKNTSPIRPMAGSKHSKKYYELEEIESFQIQNNKSSSINYSSSSNPKTQHQNTRGGHSYARRKSFIENQEGNLKTIKSENSQRVREIANHDGQERKKVYDKIHDRIVHSQITHESNTDQNALDDLKEKDLIKQLEEDKVGPIESSLFYGK